MKEQWAETPEPGYYVSDLGRVYSYRSNKYLKPYKTSKGYLQIQIARETWYLSHLVWYCFKHEKPKMMTFRDNDITNCSLENLTRRDNFLGEIEVDEQTD